MDDRQVTESLKKILMAGFGAVSSGVEKSQEMLDKLAEKGESAYEQTVAAGRETFDQLRKAYEESGIKDLIGRGMTIRKEDVLNLADALPVEDILWLQGQLAALAAEKISAKKDEPEACECAEDEACECAEDEACDCDDTDDTVG